MSALPEHAFGAAATDLDTQETREWLDALSAVIGSEGGERAHFLLERLIDHARQAGIDVPFSANTAYVNTIPTDQEERSPGNIEIEERLRAYMRWNAMAMVVKANRLHPDDGGDLGGHISSFASLATMFGTGFNHFWHAETADHGGDLLYVQGHSSPGVYARAFLEGRLSADDLAHYRQELGAAEQGARGLSSYPHPWLMPDFWQFPTGSMGLGPISSIYQARFMRYLQHRRLLDTSARKVWGVFGDGEMDEPESMSALTLAAREKLDHLIWVVNCNLQRLDGPVRGNGRIIDELEALFAGAGWRVIKLVWGSDWDELLARDTTGALARAFAATVDGQFQTFAAKDGHYNREHFFGQDPQLAALARSLTDHQIDRLTRGGHDLAKIHAAYLEATRDTGQPTVILAQTKKGYGMGAAGQGRMTTHQQKKLEREDLIAFRDRFKLPLDDEQAAALAFFKPADDSPEMRYLRERRAALGGSMPQRRATVDAIPVPPVERYAAFALRADGKEMSTTMAFVRMLTNLLKDPQLGPRIVPIVADEARTFGMANLFKQIGIYSSVGQHYEPEDIGSVLSYREATDGQILEEGISEAGAISSWTAAATSYAVHGLPMLPFYIYYSMFGFQRVGDLIWAAADQRARGFLLGATAGRTTLGGEGLQHQDGSSLVQAATVPNCRAYDPCFAGEFAVILDHGMRAMLEERQDVFFYVTLMNENYAQPSLPDGVEGDVVKGLYRWSPASSSCDVRLVGSGTILREVIEAARLLAEDWQVQAEVWSATSFSEAARDAREVERWNRLHPLAEPRISHLQHCLRGATPIVAATDYVRAWPQSIAEYVTAPFTTLGTDGFGRSDTRARLRSFFEVDRRQVVLAALTTLAAQGRLDRARCAEAITRYGLSPERTPSWSA